MPEGDVVASEATIAALLQALRDPDERVQRRAIQVLRNMRATGPAVESALLDLLRAAKYGERPTFETFVRMVEANKGGPAELWPSTAEEMIVSLAGLPSRSAAVEAMVLELLSDADPRAQSYGVQACARLGLRGETFKEALVALVERGDEHVRSEALKLLGYIDPATPEVAASQDDRLRTGDLHDRFEVARERRWRGASAAEIEVILLECLREGNQWIRRVVLEELPSDWSELPSLRDSVLMAVDDPDVRVREAAIKALSRSTAEGQDILEAMKRRLDDASLEVRLGAAQYLMGTGYADSQIIHALVSCLDAEYDHTYEGAAYVLDGLADEHPKAIEATVDHLLMQDIEAHSVQSDPYAFHPEPELWLGGAGHRAWTALESDLASEVLFDRIRGPDPRRRLAALRVLATGALRPNHPDVVTLLRALEDQSPPIREIATHALGRVWSLQKSQVIVALLERLDDDMAEVRGAAATVLADFGDSDSMVIQDLQARLAHGPSNPLPIAVTLARLHAAGTDVQEILLQAMQGEDRSALHQAAHALCSLEEADPSTVNALLALSAETDSERGREAGSVLAHLARHQPEICEHFLMLSADPDPAVRRQAVLRLPDLKTVPTKPILDALHRCMTDADPSVREAAITAIDRLAGAERSRQSRAVDESLAREQ